MRISTGLPDGKWREVAEAARAFELGCEGIVSKRLGSPCRSGRADCWLKVKNPAAPAVTREAEEDWISRIPPLKSAEQWTALSFSNVWRKLSNGLRAVTAILRNIALLSPD
jgi:hypothetical protein